MQLLVRQLKPKFQEVIQDFFFSIRYDQSRRGRGHSYRLYLPPCSSSARFNFFTYRVINAWNNLPPETDFGSLYTFKRGLNSKILSHFCKVNFL